ncbi:c-type cytochrome [Cohnella zeiphila]|uniref:c-type cytochrome n=1 Tax=Cohnella zeiphila TaxID=2761120 RepID=UPI001EE271B8|nr:cytochrome c [Cohnella zeiphila]
MYKLPILTAIRARPALRRPAAALLGLGIAAILLAACGSGGGSSSPAASSKPLEGPEETVKLYRTSCISCHGTELQGRMGDESNLQKVGSRMTEDQIRAQIENGGSLMPAFSGKLKPDQIDALASWLAGHK